MGYPYPFDDLVVIDLPSEERNAALPGGHRPRGDPDRSSGRCATATTRWSTCPTTPTARWTWSTAARASSTCRWTWPTWCCPRCAGCSGPAGYLALDTPNARVTRLQQAAFIDPDHEHEYTHAELRAKLARAGFEVVEAKGLNYAGPSLAAGPLRRRRGGHGPGAVQPDRGLLPAGLRVPGARGLSEPGAHSGSVPGRPTSRRQCPASGAGERTRTSTPSGDRDLNPARLPIPPRPQRPRSAGEQGVYGHVPMRCLSSAS